MQEGRKPVLATTAMVTAECHAHDRPQHGGTKYG